MTASPSSSAGGCFSFVLGATVADHWCTLDAPDLAHQVLLYILFVHLQDLIWSLTREWCTASSGVKWLQGACHERASTASQCRSVKLDVDSIWSWPVFREEKDWMTHELSLWHVSLPEAAAKGDVLHLALCRASFLYFFPRVPRFWGVMIRRWERKTNWCCWLCYCASKVEFDLAQNNRPVDGN